MKKILNVLFICIFLLALSCSKSTDASPARVAKPTVNIQSGEYTSVQTITISCVTENAQIRYTLNGTEPTTNSVLYTGALVISNSCVLKAKAFKEGLSESETMSVSYSILLPSIGALTITPPAGSYNVAQMININCETPEVDIYYTLNGSEPDTSAFRYTTPFEVSTSLLLKAKAFKFNYSPSATVSANYMMNVTMVATPQISLPSGTYSTPKQINLTCSTVGAEIHYSLDSSIPTMQSPLYTHSITIDSSCVLNVKAFKQGLQASQLAQAVYTYSVASPEFSAENGLYYNDFDLTIQCATPNAEIRYTENGSDPTVNSILYTGTIRVNKDTVIKAKAYKTGFVSSPIATGSYNMKVSTPEISLPAGVYYDFQTVSIQTDTENAQIRYTLDGSTPNANSNLYTGPISVNQPENNFKIIAIKNNYQNSQIVNSNYLIAVRDPEFSLPAGSYDDYINVSISCQTPGASIYYTLDGSAPSANSSLYTQEINIRQSSELRAIAVKEGLSNSNIVLANYQLDLPIVDAPQLSVNSGEYSFAQTLSITCATPGAVIRYTINGSEPTETSPIYTSPISIDNDAMIMVRAFKDHFYPSSLVMSNYIISMKFIPNGSFLMGNNNGLVDEVPAHQVSLNSYYISQKEVTVFDWNQIMGSIPPENSNLFSSYPVMNVSWYATLVYCNKRSVQEGLIPCYSINGSSNPDTWGTIPTINNNQWNNVVCNWSATGYRLPTEAEWEYASRGAHLSNNTVYSGSDNYDLVAWVHENADETLHSVRTKNANEVGIYDMSGNVFEWVWDWYGNYSTSSQNNPQGPSVGTNKICRGGGWRSSYTAATVFIRPSKLAYDDENYIGFRVVKAN